ncbi:MAG: hypothetical protein QOJ62_1290 [Actinomycetota bacterium]|nr:hypothetical protein [Actinomycetota bacterium]
MALLHQPSGDPEVAGERWRNALAHLEYAERHGAPESEVERLADEVIEARVAMLQVGMRGGWQLPDFAQSALDRDRQLLQVWPPAWDEMIGPPRGAAQSAAAAEDGTPAA